MRQPGSARDVQLPSGRKAERARDDDEDGEEVDGTPHGSGRSSGQAGGEKAAAGSQSWIARKLSITFGNGVASRKNSKTGDDGGNYAPLPQGEEEGRELREINSANAQEEHLVEQQVLSPRDMLESANVHFGIDVESPEFSFTTGAIIMLNTVVIGLECQQIRDKVASAFYQKLETVFTVLYVAEVALRIMQKTPRGFFCPRTPAEGSMGWNLFDFGITGVGAIDFVIKLFGATNAISSHSNVLRLLRILRIVRVFRMLKFLKDMEYTLMSALVSVIRCCVLVFIIDFIGAVVITHLLHDTEDNIIKEMFGQLSVSMFHLFEVMVDGLGAMAVDHELHGGMTRMVIITEKVMDEVPMMWIFWVAFVFVGTISLMALVPAIFVELNLRDAEATRVKEEAEAWEERVNSQQHLLESLFRAADADGSDSVSREEIDEAFKNPDLMAEVGLDGLIDEKGDKIDMIQMRMEFGMVFDSIESEGKAELCLNEFLDAFRKLRQKPVSAEVLALQREIFSLREFIKSEMHMVHGHLGIDDEEVVQYRRQSMALGVRGDGAEGAGRASQTRKRSKLSVAGGGGGGGGPGRPPLTLQPPGGGDAPAAASSDPRRGSMFSQQPPMLDMMASYHQQEAQRRASAAFSQAGSQALGRQPDFQQRAFSTPPPPSWNPEQDFRRASQMSGNWNR